MIKLKPASSLLLLSLTAFFLCLSLQAQAIKMVDITLPDNDDPMYGDLDSRSEAKNGIVFMNTTHYMREDTDTGLQGELAGTALMSMGFDCEQGDLYISNGVKQFDLEGKLIKNVTHTKYMKTTCSTPISARYSKLGKGFCGPK